MKVAVIGGKLQGVEAAYLAKKAGWEVIVVDKNEGVPAQNLGDEFFRCDVTAGTGWKNVLGGCRCIIPALEDKEALQSLSVLSEKIGVPLAFDPAAYRVSSSKIESNKLFIKSGVPMPRLWPECEFPLVVKPSGLSGSAAVNKIDHIEALHQLRKKTELSDWVIQEFVDGPSYSIEIIGFAGEYRTFQVTELEMDAVFDCKRVLAPADISSDLVNGFEQIALDIARSLELSGIMDVEVILHKGQLKVLEIDARLPSQTPAAVYHSTGINMVEILGNTFGYNKLWNSDKSHEMKFVVYEHLQITPEKAEICGEHIMADAGPLEIYRNFFGADEVITNYKPGKKSWVAALINIGNSREEAWEKRCEVLRTIVKKSGLKGWEDCFPVSQD